MSMLKLGEQNPSELFLKDVILNKPEGRRAEYIEHTPVGYDKIDKIVSGTSDYLAMHYNAFNKTPLKEMVQMFDFKDWPK